ncbi:MAG: putative component of viral defense system (DUF524 family) [Spirosomataceae bacterium]
MPSDVQRQLMANEKVYYFSYIAFKGGCGEAEQKENYWVTLSDRRVMYKTKISEGASNQNTYVERDGDLPFDKISFIEVSEGQDVQGCSTVKAAQLRISTSGGTIVIPISTKEKGHEIRRVYSELRDIQ